MADYSEFPTTPTAWQEAQAQDWETVTPLETEVVDVPRRNVDLVALVPGLVFIGIAIVFMTGVELPAAFWHGGGFLWIVLIGAGVALLVSELRKGRRRRT